ncbi:SDR family oxidoreductase [Patescibacteria group bacterium]|nr:SDR family oxidoreductase [Patescibacteria group bacterium]
MNRTVLVIGASGGIGEQVTRQLLEQGYFVIGTYSNHSISITDADNFKTLKLDLSSLDSIKELFDNLSQTPLYAIVNCAGVCEYENNGIDDDISVWNRAIAVNLTANFVIAKYANHLLEDNGRFIMISSTDAMYGGAITASYAASKAGVNSLTKSLSLLFKDKKISVNSVAPGWVNTRMIAGTGEEFLRQVEDVNPLKRIANPADIANVISFLLKPESEYINGQIITVDGGYTNQDPTLILEEEAV